MLNGRPPRKWPRRAGHLSAGVLRDEQFDEAVRRIEALAAQAKDPTMLPERVDPEVISPGRRHPTAVCDSQGFGPPNSVLVDDGGALPHARRIPRPGSLGQPVGFGRNVGQLCAHGAAMRR